MPKRNDIKSILVIGSGPIVIGQACEFDYSGTQACKALKEEGYKVILVNSNPATIMTDPDFSHRTYVEPLTTEVLEKIRELAGPKACTSSGQMEIFNLICRSIGITTRKTNSDCAQIPTSQWGIPILTRRFITKAHQEGKLVHIWTIDDENEMYKLIDFGIDGLMTDKPSVLKKALQLKGLF